MVSFVAGVALGFLAVSLALLYWHFFGYPLLMVAVRDKRNVQGPDSGFPKLSVVLPVYNEAGNIERRVANLLDQEYPKDRLEIVIVESGSTDGTLAVARSLAARTEFVRVVDQGARLGKASAVAAGKAVAQGSIIVVSDANTVYDRATLKELVRPFADSKVGGVGGRFTPRNSGDPKAAGSNMYWSLEEIMRVGEATLDSCCTFHGEVYAWRRELVEPDSTAINDDFDAAVQIRRKGFRVGYAPKAIALEMVPTEIGDMATQWRKNALGAIQVGFRNMRYLLGHPSFYSYLIFPSHKGLQVLQPFLVSVALVSLVVVLASGAVLEGAVAATTFGVVAVISAAVLLREIGRTQDAAAPATLHAWSLLQTFFAFQYAVLLGWKDYLTGKRDVRWTKVESTRM